MPSHLHERFLDFVEDTVRDGIKDASRQLRRRATLESVDVATQLGKIYKGRSTTIDLRGLGDVPAIVRRSPDATFYHPSQPHLPRLVVEVSYSQTSSDLQKLAKNYIIGSHGSIRYVVGFALPYVVPSSPTKRMRLRKKCAKVSVWKGSMEDNGTDTTIRCTKLTTMDLCNADGVAQSGTLELDVHDLLPCGLFPSNAAGLRSNVSVKLPLTKFSSFLSTMEAKTRVCKRFVQRYNLRNRIFREQIPRLFARPTRS